MRKILIIVTVLCIGHAAFAQESEPEKSVGRPDIPGDLFVDFGFNFITNFSPNMKINPWASRTVNLYYQYSKMIGESHIGISPGAGVGITKYGFRENVTLTDGANGINTVDLVDVLGFNATPRKSQYDAVYIDVPIDIWYYANRYDKRGFKVGIGGKAGIRVDSKTKIVYREDDFTKKSKQKERWGLNQFRYGVHLKIGYGVFHLWGAYMFSPIFDSARLDPTLQNPNTWTAGISIAGF